MVGNKWQRKWEQKMCDRAAGGVRYILSPHIFSFHFVTYFLRWQDIIA